MTAATRRPTRIAALNARRCENTDTELFYGDKEDEQKEARTECRRCPRVVSCLRGALAEEAWGVYQWGVHGGLTADQRNALRAAALLGERPDLVQARSLVRSRFRYVLEDGIRDNAPLQVLAARISAEWMPVSVLTVRVAVWWLNGEGSLVRTKTPGDTRGIRDRVLDDFVPVMLRLRASGARQRDVAAYLGAKLSMIASILSMLEQEQRDAVTAEQAVAA
ncbi:WhiB family transcriptional regulator [Streptomyces sp. NPDC088348]|uniref:WhiB family transcriptional regulator n=1 Tax=Streptomyces sp. NPDC088348 TaxID=3365853 RepID=UPI0037F7D828